MARLNFNADGEFLPNRPKLRADDAKPANINTPAKTPFAETRELELDDVFEEPSRRPL
jgi:hypothetical protein